MRSMFLMCGAAAMIALNAGSALAQSAPGQTVNVTPNQQTTSATAVSNPTGQNISQQNNFYDPGSNSFGPGVSCTGPYLASSVYRNDSSTPGVAGSGFANVGGTVGVVIPINGSNKKCQEFVNEIVFQREIDTCLTMMKQGFSFDADGQYAALAKRCSGIHFNGQPVSSANPLSPPPPPTVITVPASPTSGIIPLPGGSGPHADNGAVAPAPVSAGSANASGTRATTALAHTSSYCQAMNDARKRQLLARFKAGKHRHETLDQLHAACIPDSEIMAAL